jgi:hypothetical protein
MKIRAKNGIDLARRRCRARGDGNRPHALIRSNLSRQIETQLRRTMAEPSQRRAATDSTVPEQACAG